MQFKGRYIAFAVFIALVLGAFVVRLFDMQFVHGEENLTAEQEFSRKTVRLTGPRGKIVDTNGLPLAYNKTSYNVDFVRDPYQKGETYREAYTKGIIKAIDIIEKNGGKTISIASIRSSPNCILSASTIRSSSSSSPTPE